MKIDLRLYAVIDRQHAGGFALPDLAKRVVDGGATLVQLREKLASRRRMIEEARAVHAALAGTGVPLLINDRVDVALAAGAAGVHLGWDDIPPERARALLGPEAIIGLSIRTHEQARAAPLHLVDYVCIGGAFATASKHTTQAPIGAEGVSAIASAVRARAPGLPVGAIAGIDATNAAEIMAAGVDGVAVISALSRAADPAAAARELRDIVDRTLAARSGP
jgi:thiamine-phosphate pyrophosphorylase